MPETTYTYSISADFPASKVNPNKLRAEILDSSIATVLVEINTFGDSLDIVFQDALTTGEKTVLDGDTIGPAGGLIAQHDNSLFVLELFPDEILMGTRIDYQMTSSPVNGEIQYTKVIAKVGTYNKIRFWLDTSVGTGTLKAAVYTSDGSIPVDKITEGSISYAGSSNDSFLEVTLNSPLTIPIDKEIWLAVLSTTDAPIFASTDSLVPGFHPVYFEQTTDDLFPAVATPASNTGSAIYAALTE